MTQDVTRSERLTVSLIPDASMALSELQERTGMKKVDLINRALQIYAWFDEAGRRGATLLLKEADGQEASRVHIL